MKTHIAINGACGRMGQRLVALAKEDPHLQVVAAVDSPTNPLVGRDAGELAGVGPIGVPVTGELPLDPRPACVIDFSAPTGTMAILPVCVGRQIPLVVSTTGHTEAQKAEIEAAAHKDPFDRLLAAQAIGEGAALVTADPVFGQYPVQVEW